MNSTYSPQTKGFPMSVTGILPLEQWARENGDAHTWSTVADCHEPPRDYVSGEMFAYVNRNGDASWVIIGADGLPQAENASYLLDDGRSVSVFYVAGYRGEGGPMILHPYPTNYNGDGTPKVRADDGRPVDHSTWVHKPRRAYHVKVRPVA